MSYPALFHLRFVFSLLFVLMNLRGIPQNPVDSLRIIAEGAHHDTTRIQAYMEWDDLIYLTDPELDIRLNKKVEQICDKNLSDFGLTKKEREYFYRIKGITSNNLGLALYYKGDFLKALEYLQNAQVISEDLKDTVRLASSINNIGMIYKQTGQFEKALNNYRRSMELDGKDPASKATYLNNIGLCYSDMGDTASALDNYRESIYYAEQVGDSLGMANTLCNIALIYFYKKDIPHSIALYENAIKIYESLGDKNGMAYALIAIGKALSLNGDPVQGEKKCLSALVLAEESRSLIRKKECSDCLYRVYKKMGKTDKALEHHEKYLMYNDSINEQEKEKELYNLDYKFAYERKQIADSLAYENKRQIELLQHKTELQNTKRKQYVLYAGIGILLLFGAVVFRGYRNKKKDHRIIAIQKKEVEMQKVLVEEKNKEITDSINYAKRIQDAILPDQEIFNDFFSGSFIFYQPKDIVAGDFYWMERAGNSIIFAVADCTGHGVPGAMVSVVCHNALNRAVKEFGLTESNRILDKTRELVIETFEKETVSATRDVIRDGMDIALCVYNPESGEMHYSGANNSIYLIRNNELHEFGSDKQPIGKYAAEKPFSKHQIQLLKGDHIYLFTDGFADQFGGKEGKKFKYKQLKQELLSQTSMSMQEQCNQLRTTFTRWKGAYEQVDDVCIMGIRI